MESKIRKSRPFTMCTSILMSFLVLGFVATPAKAADKVKWNRLVGIVAPNDIVSGIVDGTPAPWTVTSGTAEVNFETGQVKFKVRGLVIAGDPSFANIGTTTVITTVKGTLVCNENDDAVLVDTPAVALSPQGNAHFNGNLELPPSCSDEPDDIVFLIRIAGVASGFEFLLDHWNAFGAVRIRVAN